MTAPTVSAPATTFEDQSNLPEGEVIKSPRVDTFYRSASPGYSMAAKVIAYGDRNDQAIRRMRIALSEMIIEGIKTNIVLHQELMQDAGFIKGENNIHYLEKKLAAKGEMKKDDRAG